MREFLAGFRAGWLEGRLGGRGIVLCGVAGAALAATALIASALI